MNTAAVVSPASINPVDRLFGLVELMSKHASTRLDGHESARISAAIIGHLRILGDTLPQAAQVQNDADAWLNCWETIAQRQAQLRDQQARQSVLGLLANYSEVRC